eukprot:9183695-Ditylum_brightwellii.AAC.1
MHSFDMVSKEEDAIELLKAIKSTFLALLPSKGHVKPQLLGKIQELGQADDDTPTDKGRDKWREKFQWRIFVIKACQFCYQRLKEELHNELAQGWNGYPNTLDQAYTMLSERRDHGTSKTKMETQLVFHAGGGSDQDDNVVLPAGGEKAKPHIKCNKCRKQGHFAN